MTDRFGTTDRSGMTDRFGVFVYFRTRGTERARVRALLGAHLDAIGARFGFRADGGLKDETRADGDVTWLEVYPPVDADTLAALQAAIGASADQTGLGALATTGRHTEVFRMFERAG